MKESKITSQLIRFTVLATILLSFQLVASRSYARPSVPVAPPSGRAWVWVDSHWELVDASPPGGYDWSPGYWDKGKGVWIEGSWKAVKPKKGRTWIDGQFDSGKGIWIAGHWGKQNKSGVVISINAPSGKRVPSAPPMGKTWVWVTGHWDLVPAPQEGPREWKPGYWDTRTGVWIPGAWVEIGIPAPSGKVWIAPHWDATHRIWVQGTWGKAPRVVEPARPGPKDMPPKPRRNPGPGMSWQWDPVRGEWIAVRR